MIFSNIPPEVAEVATGLSDTAIIAIAVCVTVIVVTWILRVPAFKVRKCRDGITFKVGDIAQHTPETSDTLKEDAMPNNRDSIA